MDCNLQREEQKDVISKGVARIFSYGGGGGGLMSCFPTSPSKPMQLYISNIYLTKSTIYEVQQYTITKYDHKTSKEDKPIEITGI